MNPPPDQTYVLPRWMRPWEEFWFTPADPSVLALMRVCAGMIVVYTMVVYSFTLQDFMGEYAWHDLAMRRQMVAHRPLHFGPLDFTAAGQLPEPETPWQTEYRAKYRQLWGSPPPPPYPDDGDQKMVDYLTRFRATFGTDLRINGLKLPKNEREERYAEGYMVIWGQPPPAYPANDEEEKAIHDYMVAENGVDPRNIYAQGMPVWSIWFHVTDPTAMAVIHGIVVACAVCFMIGFCTRFSTAILWFGYLCYIHRNPTILFGVDTMMTIVLFYLMFSPCGQYFSIDRLIRKWWATAKPGVVAWWYQLLRQPVPTNLAPPETVPDKPTPSVAANVVIRLLQIHVCIIYLMSGLSKLQGGAWWRGDAIWMCLGNYEFAPMQFELYMSFLRFLGGNKILFDTFVTFSGLFTLAFEIGYAFLIWRPRMRWIVLSAAIMLHAGIGLFLGLKTFSLMMLVLNMAFLRKEEVYAIFKFVSRPFTQSSSPAPTPQVAATAITAK
jgi:hypothetical protein